MSLIPSESGHFPDLIGQHHGYHPKAHRPPLKRRQSAAPAKPVSPTLPKNAEDSGDTKSQNGVSSKAGPDKSAEPVELFQKNAPADSSIPPRRTLPISPPRSVAQMRAKIETQETVVPHPASTRPRTPPRGLAVAHLPPVVPEKPVKLASSRLPLPSLPRHRNIKLVRFIMCEFIAIGVLILAAEFDFSHLSAEDLVSLFWRSLASAAFVGAAVLPIIFYGLPDTLRGKKR